MIWNSIAIGLNLTEGDSITFLFDHDDTSDPEVSAMLKAKRFPGVQCAWFAAVEIKYGRKLDVTVSSLNRLGFQVEAEAS